METKIQNQSKIEAVNFKRQGELISSQAVTKYGLEDILRDALTDAGVSFIETSEARLPSVARVRFVDILVNTEFVIEVVNQIPEECQEVIWVEAGKTLRSSLPAIRINSDGMNSDIIIFSAVLSIQKKLIKAAESVMDKLSKVEYIYY